MSEHSPSAKKKHWRWVVLGVISVPVVWFLVWGGMNATGFCWAEKRWLSDEEIYQRVFEHIKNGPNNANMSDKQNQEVSSKTIIPYASKEDFFKRNPNCCKIQHRSDSIPMLYIIFGDARGYVSMEYQVNYRDSSGQAKSFIIREAPGIANCGRTFTHYFD